jgi:hypothetical protein
MTEKVAAIEKHFTVVMRGPAAVVFWQNEKLLVADFPTALGPVNIIYTSRWIKTREQVTIPGNLWIEITGKGPSLEEVLVPFANAGLTALPVLSVSANAAVGEPEIELGFDSTPGACERDYFQSYVPPESSVVHLGRHINVQATITLLNAIGSHPDSVRLFRAANQYHLALDSWKLGRETLSLAHLWMALEALTKAKIRKECAIGGFRSERELATKLSVELKQLDAAVRKTLILKGDEECYNKARDASDGFEHGFLGYDKISEYARDVRHRMAEHIRKAIFDLCDIGNNMLDVLNHDPFDKPMGHWPVVKYVRGRLLGDSPDLAAEGKAYPFLRWNPIVKTCEVEEVGKLKIQFEEKFTPELADGISFQMKSYEAWQPD